MPALNQYAPDAVESPLMFQGWKLVTFLHWRYPIAQIRPLVPPDLELDLFDGSAWVGLVPFVVTQLRSPFIPALPWISQFPETNVRTYVRDRHGKPSIWFFTLDAARLPAVLAARTFFRLPYRWARMRVGRRKDIMQYESVRRAPFGSARNRATIRIGDAMTAEDLDIFLTARFRLYTLWGGRVAFVDAEHPPWPLHRAEVIRLEQNLIEESGVPAAAGSPLVHYSPGVDARIAPPKYLPLF
ncbi:MAG TPA: DUF2071 domain-containing protein [Bryobacteraceae bacterium]|nr:DUF2071 domain-containing protein [Bryobacteraceae bacterium]